MDEGWGRYVELLQELDGVRTREVARNAGELRGAADQSTHADGLEARLTGQRGMLQRLGTELGLRVPGFGELPPPEPVEPAQALARIAGKIDLADAEARRAAERSDAPVLMPNRRPQARAATVYGVAALVVALLQAPGWYRLVTDKTPPSAVLALFVVPAILFAIAWLLLRFGVRSRPTRTRSRSSTRLGLLLCFGVGPAGLLLFVAVAWRSGA